MLKRNAGAVDKLKESDDQLEKDGLIDPFDRAALYRSSTNYTYSDVPEGAGPPYPKRKAQRTPPPKPTRG